MNDKLYINLTRIGKNGSGMSIYSRKFVDCITQHFIKSNVYAILPANALSDYSNIKNISVPNFISNTPKISLLRPLLWYLYSYLLFPRINGRVITTTHHLVPYVDRQIITVMDLRPYFYPDSVMQTIYFKGLLPHKIKKVDGVLTISDATKNLLVKHYNCDPNKVHVIPISVDISHFTPKQASYTGEPYLLMVGARWRHKNAHEVIKMFRAWEQKYRLKIITGKGPYLEFLKKMVDDLNIQDKVELIEHYISDTELLELYQKASALIYPSLMEGFGIPPIEAMACGVPVIVSDIDVFREICADVPIYVKLGDEQSWYDVFKILNNSTLVECKIKLGLERAKFYNEGRMKDAIIDAMQNIWPDIK